MIPALVLTAGLATRLRPLSLVRAKAAVPVAGVPLVRRILQQLSRAGAPFAILNLHHLPETIARAVGDGTDLGIPVRYSWENPVLGSAGGPRRALPLLGGVREEAGTTFYVVNGDTLADVDLAALARTHRESGALVTMAVVPNEKPDKYGGIVARGDHVATGFVGRGAAQPSHHFVGVQIVDSRAFAGVPDNTPSESVGALYPALMASRPGSVRVFPCSVSFHDIGTPADYFHTSLQLAAQDDGTLNPGTGSVVHPSASIERTIVWDDVDVGAGAILRECIVTDRVSVPPGTSWERLTLRAVGAGDALAPGERRVGAIAAAPF
jgi:NDP-sugar pyrophosphorylase family protein